MRRVNLNSKITVIPGDGIGPQIVENTLRVLKHIAPDLEFEEFYAGPSALDRGLELIPESTVESILTNKVVLKGPITTPVGKGFRSINVQLRKKFDLFANLRPVVSFDGTKSKYENIDILTIRENTEGLYCGEGQTVNDAGDYAEAKSIVTEAGSRRIVKFAFEQAIQKKRKKVTVFHKANILKSTSGLFLETARFVAKEYSQIEFQEMIVDNACMQLVMNPHQFDVIATTNLFGDIISDLCAGLVGGLGMAPGANIGKDIAIFEAVHGSAPDIAGKNIANPISIMLAGALLLDHCNHADKGARLRNTIREVVAEGKHTTGDLGGNSSTTEFTDALLAKL